MVYSVAVVYQALIIVNTFEDDVKWKFRRVVSLYLY